MSKKVTTGDGEVFEVGTFSSGGGYARQPRWFPGAHDYEAKTNSEAETMRVLSDTHGGIKSVKG